MSPELVRPEVHDSGRFEFPTPSELRLDNGLSALIYDIPGQYVLCVRIVIPVSLSAEPQALEGITTLMARLLDEGTRTHGPEEFGELLERHGAAMSAAAVDGALTVSLDVPGRYLDPALALVAEALREPLFAPAEVDRMIKTRIAEIDQERASAPHRAAREFIATHFAPDQRASRPTAGTKATVGAITPADVHDYHARTLGPNGSTVVIAGDLSALDLQSTLDGTLARWSAPRHTPPELPVAAAMAQDAARVVIVDRPGSVQTEISLGWSGPDKHVEGGWAPFPVLSFLVGGSPNARIDAVLREDKGFTYGIRSVFRPRRAGGLFLVNGSVRADSTVESVSLLLDILRTVGDGFTQEETQAGVDFVTKTAPGRFATAEAIADEAAALVVDRLPLDATTTNLDAMRNLSPADLAQRWREFVPPAWTIILVGDAASFSDEIRELGVGEVFVVAQ